MDSHFGETPLELKMTEALRRILRHSDLNSRALLREYQLSGPQLAVLQQLARTPTATVSGLAKAVHVGVPTVTGVVDRLERGGLVERSRDSADRRQVLVEATEAGLQVLQRRPSLLSESFRKELRRMQDWEQQMLLSSLQRLAQMMEVPDSALSPKGESSANRSNADTTQNSDLREPSGRSTEERATVSEELAKQDDTAGVEAEGERDPHG